MMKVEIFKKGSKNTLTSKIETFFSEHSRLSFFNIEYAIFVDTAGKDWYSALIVYNE